MTNYIMPTAADVPPIRVYFEEIPYQYGPSGAKGSASSHGRPAPAIIERGEHATGLRVDHAHDFRSSYAIELSCTVNGASARPVSIRWPGCWDVCATRCSLTGPRKVREGECGACSVIVDARWSIAA